MLAAISLALEERDQTHGHGVRVAAFAAPVARSLDWSDARLAALELGATLHDIGKVSVRPDVLCKPEPLSLEEQAAIRVHPEAGAALVNDLRWARPALPYVLWHHERWDGGGYPWGLCGPSIPLEARIIALADGFDAMTSPRPYRAALTREQALAEIEAGAGTQFDPWLAGIFLDAWASIAAA